MSESTALLLHVRRCQRRLTWVKFIQIAWVTTAIATLMAAVTVYVLRPEIGSAGRWVGGAAALALLVAAAVAWWRRPTLHSTGRTLDRRLGLDDRVIAALAVRDD